VPSRNRTLRTELDARANPTPDGLRPRTGRVPETRHSPETEFILRCCAAACGGPPTDIGALLAPSFDWEALVRATRRHRVTPLIAHHLASVGFSCDHNPAVATIIDSYKVNTLRNVYLTETLTEILAEFNRAAIPAISFKGPILGKIAYGDPMFRVFSDLDILVRTPDIPRSADLLKTLGYEPTTYDFEVFQSRFFAVSQGDFRKYDSGIAVACEVDLHWQLSAPYFPFGPKGEAMWERSIWQRLNGLEVRTLAHEDHLLFLCVHMARDGWESLGAICDVAQLIRRVQLDWSSLSARAAESGSLRMLRVALILAHDLLGTELPVDVLSAARSDNNAVSIAASVATDILVSDNSESRPFREFLASLRAIEMARDRVRYCALHALAPTVKDRQFFQLPKMFFPLYYILRPIRFASQQMARRRRKDRW